MSGFGPARLPWRVGPYRNMGFTLLELMIVVSIIGLLATLVVPEANRSLQRSKINEVALELAGWLESLRITNTSDVSCVATFNQAAVQPLGVSTILYTISSVQQSGTNVLAPSCTQYIDNFRIGLSGVSGTFRVASPATFQFTRRGNIIAANANDIRIFLVGSTYLRCLRPQVLLGTISIGQNNNATGESDVCADESFRTF